MLDVYKILKNTAVEGPGIRFCIWVQGCKRHCPKCFAKDTWTFGTGTKYSVEELFKLIKAEKGKIEGVTFLGGEPFEQAEELFHLAEKVKKEGLSVICFTGYSYEELLSGEIKGAADFLHNIDLLIDGRFEHKNYDLSRPWVGSSNQKFIYLTNFYSPEKICKYKNRVEVRIAKDGKLEINGMGDFEEIQKKFCLQLGQDKVK